MFEFMSWSTQSHTRQSMIANSPGVMELSSHVHVLSITLSSVAPYHALARSGLNCIPQHLEVHV